jgi:HK97 family phage major capsid protein
LAGAAAITAAEVVELYHKLPDFYSESAVWTTRNATLGAIRGLTGNPFLFNPTPQGDAPYGDLYAKRVLLSDQVPAMATGVKSIIAGNWSFYALVERSGLVVSRNPYLYQANGQVGFFVNARWGGDVLQAEAFQYATQA